MRTIQIRLQPDIYPISMYVGSVDIEAFRIFLKNDLVDNVADEFIEIIKEMESKSGGCYISKYETIVLFFFEKEHNNNPMLEIVPHEIFHGVMQYAKIIGLTYCYKSEEAFAYLYGYFSNIILTELLKSDATI